MVFSSKEALQRALHCAVRADEAFDENTRHLFLRLRDNWIEVASISECPAPGLAPNSETAV
jgi:hypothetical protein